jgi:hypothetical protein
MLIGIIQNCLSEEYTQEYRVKKSKKQKNKKKIKKESKLATIMALKQQLDNQDLKTKEEENEILLISANSRIPNCKNIAEKSGTKYAATAHPDHDQENEQQS